MISLFTENKTDINPSYEHIKSWLRKNIEQVKISEYKEKILIDKGCLYDDIYKGRLLDLPEDADAYHKLYLDYTNEVWKSAHLYQPDVDWKTDEVLLLLTPVHKNQVIEAMSRALANNLHFNFLNLCIEFKSNGQLVTKAQLKKLFALMPRTKIKGVRGFPEAHLCVDLFFQDIIENCIFYPSIKWAKNLSWNEKDTYDGIFKALGITDEFSKKIFLTACKASMNRWVDVGADNHNVFILQGEQGARKSSFIRAISPLGSFLEADKYEGKDDLMNLHRHLLVEFGEIEQITSKKDSESLKFFITKNKDDFRIPYAELPKTYPRAYSIWGTANSESFLKDQTGSRRFFIVRIPREHIIDVDWVKENREQFWAQIHQDKSLKSYLDKPDEKHLQELNKGMYVDDDCLERIEQLLSSEANQIATEHGKFHGHLFSDGGEKYYPLQASWLYRVAFFLGKNETVNKGECAKISRWLNANGFTNKDDKGNKIQISLHGKQHKVYVKIPQG